MDGKSELIYDSEAQKELTTPEFLYFFPFFACFFGFMHWNTERIGVMEWYENGSQMGHVQ